MLTILLMKGLMMTKTTIETINGQLYTVIWHGGKSHANNFKQIKIQEVIVLYSEYGSLQPMHIATALPAIPRYPRPKDAELLYRYMAEGIEPWLYWLNKKGNMSVESSFIDPIWQSKSGEITHAINSATGQRIEAAIED